MKTILFIDTETTGLPEVNRLKRSSFYEPEMYDKYDNARMIEFACMMYKIDDTKNMFYVQSYSTLIAPDAFEVKNTDIHGIETNHLMEYGQSMADVLEYINDNFVTKCDEIVGHNVSFDVSILLSETCRLIDSVKPNTRSNSKRFHTIYENIKNKPSFCTMKFFKEKMNWPKWPKLVEMYNALHPNKPCTQRHRALDDVKLTATCYKKMRSVI